MGRISPSRQNQTGKKEIGIEPVKVKPSEPRRTRAQIRRSSSPAAIERATSGTAPVSAPTTQILGLPAHAAVPGTGPKGNQVGSDADPSTPGMQGPGAVRVSPSGVEQTGMILGFRPPTREQVVDYMGGDFKNPFASNDFAGDSPAEDMMGRDSAEAQAIAAGGTVETTIDGGQVTNVSINGGPQNSMFTDPANRAFLDAPDVMSGMKAKEGQLGLVFASGQYYARNPNAGVDGAPELLPIDGTEAGGINRQAVRDYKAGEISAEDFFNDYVSKTKDEIESADIEIAEEDEDDLPVI